jgi:acetyl esterase
LRAGVAADVGEGLLGDAQSFMARSLTGFPPTFLATAAIDLLRDDAEAYGRRLADEGVRVELKRYEGTIHGFFTEIGISEQTMEAVKDTAAFLGRAFAAA